MKKKKNAFTHQQDEQNQTINEYLPFASDELFWKELITIVEDGAEASKE